MFFLLLERNKKKLNFPFHTVTITTVIRNYSPVALAGFLASTQLLGNYVVVMKRDKSQR